MRYPKISPLAMAAALALSTTAWSVSAQQASSAEKPKSPAPADAPAPAATPPATETVVVSGIRASRQQALNVKRNADSHVEVVSAEDIGKLPDKNVADALQRLPGVNISSAAGGEGGFSENDRVSIRGTSASLTQTMVNGHMVGTGDWFVLDQSEVVGRSVSYSLLPSEIVDRATVYKAPQADLVEGGVSGLVNVETRKPLSLKKPFTAELSVQAIYSDLAAKYDPQVNGILGWKNANNTAGVLVQFFREARHERRDGQEFLGYTQLNEHDHADVVAADPALNGVWVPNLIGSAHFTQERIRQGGLLEAEVKATSNLTLNLSGFSSHLAATNYDTNFMAAPMTLIGHGVGPIQGQYTVKSNTLVAANFPVTTLDRASDDPTYPLVVDKIYRPGAAAETYYIDLGMKWRATDALKVSASAGYTHGLGTTPGDLGYESIAGDGGLSYTSFGMSKPANVSFPGINAADYTKAINWGAWYATVHVVDEEAYGQADADWALDSGIFESIKFGGRLAQHKREVQYPQNGGCGWVAGGCGVGTIAWNGEKYPSNFGRDLGADTGFLSNVWHLNPTAVADFLYANSSRTAHNWQGELSVTEKTYAGYAMANLAGERWKGNVGVRVVRTSQKTNFNVPDGPNPVPNADFGPYTPVEDQRSYTDILPSANIKFDIDKELVARFSAGKTMARVDYSALAGSINSKDDLVHSGTGGNTNLKPVRSNNFDATIEWYFAPRSVLSLAVFYMDMPSYIGFGSSPQVLWNQQTKSFDTYQITSPVNTSARNQGIELGYQQPFGAGFGINANYSYCDGKDRDGNALVGSSKNTYNLETYFENDAMSARLAYTYRSDSLVGLDRSTAQSMAAVGNLSASFNYTLNEHVKITFDALNLNNPILRYYANNTDMPRAFYANGRQFYLGLKFSL